MTRKILIVVALSIAVAAIVVAKTHKKGRSDSPGERPPTTAPAEHSDTPRQENRDVSTPPSTPKLIDLGSSVCIPCKTMAPILDDLREEFEGRFQVIFLDVRENPESGTKYAIRVMNTQIFEDEKGNELFRHEGFYSRDDILGKWRELGYGFGEEAKGDGETETER